MCYMQVMDLSSGYSDHLHNHPPRHKLNNTLSSIILLGVFINRKRELLILNQRFGRPSAEFVVIYGRRRIGISELIDQFINNRNKRLLAREESKTLQLARGCSAMRVAAPATGGCGEASVTAIEIYSL